MEVVNDMHKIFFLFSLDLIYICSVTSKGSSKWPPDALQRSLAS